MFETKNSCQTLSFGKCLKSGSTDELFLVLSRKISNLLHILVKGSERVNTFMSYEYFCLEEYFLFVFVLCYCTFAVITLSLLPVLSTLCCMLRV